MARPKQMHPAEQYISDIKDDTIPACVHIKRAVDRHQNDLERVESDDDFPYYFDEDEARWYIDLFQFFILYEGEAAEEPFDLDDLPWIQFQLWCIFGWKRKSNDKRRFRKAFIMVAKKNIKTTLAACIGLIGLLFDDESGAQIYSAAANAKQAKICFRAAREISKKSPTIRKRLEVLTNNLSHMESASFFEYISSQSAQTKDGLNPHFSLIDEYHAHPTNEVHDVLDSATAAREQPLVYIISTAGVNPNGPCKEFQDYCEKILDPNSDIHDETIFTLIYTLDTYDDDDKDDDDWRDERNWIKANPSLGVSVKYDDLRAKAHTAGQLPRARNNFKMKHCNLWVQSKDAFIELNKWDKCGHKEIESPLHRLAELLTKYRGNRAIGGLDLGSVSDFTSFVLLIEVEKQWKWEVLPMFWIPEDTLKERKNKEILTPWIRKGYISTTPGDYTDHDFVEDTIKECFKFIDIKDMAYDPSGMQQMATHLENEGMEITYLSQNYYRMEPCISALEQLIISKQMNHGMNPVLRWMLGNVAIAQNTKGQRMFDKKSAPDKIDGMQALAMAVGQAMKMEDEFGSIYDTEGYAVSIGGESPVVEQKESSKNQSLPNMAEGEYS